MMEEKANSVAAGDLVKGGTEQSGRFCTQCHSPTWPCSFIGSLLLIVIGMCAVKSHTAQKSLKRS